MGPATPALRAWKKGQQGRRGCSVNTGPPPPGSPSLQPGSVVFFLGGGVGPSFEMHHVQSYFLWRWRPRSGLCTEEARSRGVSALPAPFQESPTLTPACKGREDHPSHRPSSPPQRAQGGASKPQDCSKEKMNRKRNPTGFLSVALPAPELSSLHPSSLTSTGTRAGLPTSHHQARKGTAALGLSRQKERPSALLGLGSLWAPASNTCPPSLPGEVLQLGLTL